MNNWLKNLKVGDEVVLINLRGEYLKRVVRISPTRIMIGCKNFVGVDYEERYSKKNGRLVGRSDFRYSYIVEATVQKKEQIHIHNMQSHVRKLLSTVQIPMEIEKLETLIKVLGEYQCKA